MTVFGRDRATITSVGGGRDLAQSSRSAEATTEPFSPHRGATDLYEREICWQEQLGPTNLVTGEQMQTWWGTTAPNLKIARRGFAASLAVIAVLASSCISAEPDHAGLQKQNDWPAYGGALADRYSTLDQINCDNVGSLQQAWRYDTGPGGLQTTPLIVGDTLFGVTPKQEVFALNAATGQPVWTYAPEPRGGQPVRGLSYWSDKGSARLFTSNGAFLTAVDPGTGKPIAEFGKNGSVDMRENLNRDPTKVAAYLTTPGVVFQDLIIVGFRTAETAPAAPGAVRAYDVRTGALRWTFNLIPRPGEFGNETWPAEAWQTAGGANAWAGMVVDDMRGIVYVPTGSAVDDFYGADRPGDNLFANSLVALDASTGKRLWHFQLVHHDVLDRDPPSPPVLLTVNQNGRKIDVVAQTTKHGVLFVLDRVTGKPVFPIEERAVAQSDLPDEKTSATQPFPLKPEPYARQQLTADMLTMRTPEANKAARETFAQSRALGPFGPLTVGKPTIVFPGFDGGAEWGGPAVDRPAGVIYINSNEMAWLGSLREIGVAANEGSGSSLYQQQCAVCHGPDRAGQPPVFPALTNISSRLSDTEVRKVIANGAGRMPGFPGLSADQQTALIGFLNKGVEDREVTSASGAPKAKYGFTGYKRFLDPDGYPAIAPPWGTLNAIDLNTGDYLWRKPLGVFPQLAATGQAPTGCENYGGPVATAGGIVVIAATTCDRLIRAFDSRTGAQLWSAALPFAGNATPATYVSEGRQFFVIATSGGKDPKGPQGSAYVAFALPK